ncbi:MAG: hypothetical protein R2873_22450 [Caldilineaceae bacterium]
MQLQASLYALVRLAIIVKPASDGISGKSNGASSPAMQFIDEGVVHKIQVGGKFLGAAPRPEDAYQDLSKLRKTRNVGEKCSAGGMRW